MDVTKHLGSQRLLTRRATANIDGIPCRPSATRHLMPLAVMVNPPAPPATVDQGTRRSFAIAPECTALLPVEKTGKTRAPGGKSGRLRTDPVCFSDG